MLSVGRTGEEGGEGGSAVDVEASSDGVLDEMSDEKERKRRRKGERRGKRRGRERRSARRGAQCAVVVGGGGGRAGGRGLVGTGSEGVKGEGSRLTQDGGCVSVRPLGFQLCASTRE